MAKNLNIEKSFDETTECYEKLSHFFKKCGESFGNIMSPTQKAQKFALCSPDETIPGFFGTLSVAIWQADFVFTNIDEAFKSYGLKLKLSDFFDHLFKERAKNKDNSGTLSRQYRKIKENLINESAVLYVEVCELTKKLNEIYRDYASNSPTSTSATASDTSAQNQNSHQSIFQSMNKMLVSSKIGKHYSQYMHSVSGYISFRESIKLCNKEISEYTHIHHINLNRIDDTLFQNFLTIILPKICQSLSQLGQDITEQANILQSKINQIDFETDFKEYINNSDISFKDIQVPKFVPYAFKSPYASPDQIYIQKLNINYFPVGIAIAVSDFNPETKNEVQLSKGKSVYLMEKEARNGWMLIMTSPLARIGFVPFSYLKILSKKIELNSDNIFTKKKK